MNKHSRKVGSCVTALGFLIANGGCSTLDLLIIRYAEVRVPWEATLRVEDEGRISD